MNCLLSLIRQKYTAVNKDGFEVDSIPLDGVVVWVEATRVYVPLGQPTLARRHARHAGATESKSRGHRRP